MLDFDRVLPNPTLLHALPWLKTNFLELRCFRNKIHAKSRHPTQKGHVPQKVLSVVVSAGLGLSQVTIVRNLLVLTMYKRISCSESQYGLKQDA